MAEAKYHLDKSLENSIHSALQKLGANINNPQHLAQCIQRLSDFYINNQDAQTPWSENWAQIAYVSYYLPLNYLRIKRSLNQIKHLSPLQSVKKITDYGAGPGTASLAASTEFPNWNFVLYDSHIQSQKVFELLTQSNAEISSNQFRYVTHRPTVESTDLLIASYALTEFTELPPWIYSHKNLLILEPSTQSDGRRLMQWRQQLLKKGFHAWAPCTHQKECPLLIQSKKDWCHDRLHFARPEWFLEIEKFLPFKNNTLSFSYLFVSKTQAPEYQTKTYRCVGDTLNEKGKSRILICGDNQRKFLSWLHRDLKDYEILRGDLIKLPEDPALHGQEIRIHKPL